MNRFSRIRHYVDMKDVKRRHLEELAVKKNKEKQIEEEKILRQKIYNASKSNWREDILDEGMTTGNVFSTTLSAEGETAINTVNPIDPASYTGTTGVLDFGDDLGANVGTVIRDNGTGIGADGGFNVGGQYLAFQGVGSGTNNSRFAALSPIDSSTVDTLSITAVIGNDVNGGEDPDLASEGLFVLYKTPAMANASFLQLKPDNTLGDGDGIIIPSPASHNGGLNNYSITIPEYARAKDTQFILMQYFNSGSEFDHYGITNINFKRRAPLNVLVPLDDPSAISFISVGTNEGDPKKRKKKINDQLEASDKYTKSVMGSQFPGQGTRIDGDDPFRSTTVTSDDDIKASPIGSDEVKKEFGAPQLKSALGQPATIDKADPQAKVTDIIKSGKAKPETGQPQTSLSGKDFSTFKSDTKIEPTTPSTQTSLAPKTADAANMDAQQQQEPELPYKPSNNLNIKANEIIGKSMGDINKLSEADLDFLIKSGYPVDDIFFGGQTQSPVSDLIGLGLSAAAIKLALPLLVKAGGSIVSLTKKEWGMRALTDAAYKTFETTGKMPPWYHWAAHKLLPQPVLNTYAKLMGLKSIPQSILSTGGTKAGNLGLLGLGATAVAKITELMLQGKNKEADELVAEEMLKITNKNIDNLSETELEKIYDDLFSNEEKMEELGEFIKTPKTPESFRNSLKKVDELSDEYTEIQNKIKTIKGDTKFNDAFNAYKKNRAEISDEYFKFSPYSSNGYRNNPKLDPRVLVPDPKGIERTDFSSFAKSYKPLIALKKDRDKAFEDYQNFYDNKSRPAYEALEKYASANLTFNPSTKMYTGTKAQIRQYTILANKYEKLGKELDKLSDYYSSFHDKQIAMSTKIFKLVDEQNEKYDKAMKVVEAKRKVIEDEYKEKYNYYSKIYKERFAYGKATQDYQNKLKGGEDYIPAPLFGEKIGEPVKGLKSLGYKSEEEYNKDIQDIMDKLNKTADSMDFDTVYKLFLKDLNAGVINDTVNAGNSESFAPTEYDPSQPKPIDPFANEIKPGLGAKPGDELALFGGKKPPELPVRGTLRGNRIYSEAGYVQNGVYPGGEEAFIKKYGYTPQEAIDAYNSGGNSQSSNTGSSGLGSVASVGGVDATAAATAAASNKDDEELLAGYSIEDKKNVINYFKKLQNNPNYKPKPYELESILRQQRAQQFGGGGNIQVAHFKLKGTNLFERIKSKPFFNPKDIKPPFPENDPPQLDPKTGMHPRYGKQAGRYKKLDPISANAMPSTGDPEIDAVVDKQRTKPKSQLFSKIKRLTRKG